MINCTTRLVHLPYGKFIGNTKAGLPTFIQRECMRHGNWVVVEAHKTNLSYMRLAIRYNSSSR